MITTSYVDLSKLCVLSAMGVAICTMLLMNQCNDKVSLAVTRLGLTSLVHHVDVLLEEMLMVVSFSLANITPTNSWFASCCFFVEDVALLGFRSPRACHVVFFDRNGSALIGRRR